VRDYKARHASTMLTFDAVVDAIGQIEARRSSRRRPNRSSCPRKRASSTPEFAIHHRRRAYWIIRFADDDTVVVNWFVRATYFCACG
jgi:hypothetical protein